MLYLAIILIIIILFFYVRLFSLKKEVKKITRQLQNYNNRKSNKKIDMSLLDKNVENLGIEINKLIDLYVAENRKRIRFEDEQKQGIANMSHDLRTPLTSILGYIQMAEEDAVSEQERIELLSIAKNRANRLKALLEEFFELSVIESSDYLLKSERINLKKITIDILMNLYDRFHEKQLEPEIHMLDDDVFIMADESAITRVIENLISNAITHADGNIIIILEEKDTTARLIVKNDAYSLNEENADLMFDRFYKADQSRSSKSTGLGLSIVKSLMEKMNGSITGYLLDGQLSIICEWKKLKKK